MMRYLGFLFLFLTSTTFAQQRIFSVDDTYLMPGTFTFESGISMPLGDFADKSLNLESGLLFPSNAIIYDKQSGYALPGYSIKCGFSYEVTPFLGILLQYNYYNHAFDAKDYRADLQSGNPVINITDYQSANWKMNGLTLGLFYPFKMYRTTINLHASGGIIQGTLPTYSLNYSAPNNILYEFEQSDVNGYNVGFQGGIKIQYSPFDRKYSTSPFKKIVFIAAADLFYTKINYQNILLHEKLRDVYFDLPDYEQQYQLLNLSLGLGLQFD